MDQSEGRIYLIGVTVNKTLDKVVMVCCQVTIETNPSIGFDLLSFNQITLICTFHCVHFQKYCPKNFTSNRAISVVQWWSPISSSCFISQFRNNWFTGSTWFINNFDCNVSLLPFRDRSRSTGISGQIEVI